MLDPGEDDLRGLGAGRREKEGAGEEDGLQNQIVGFRASGGEGDLPFPAAQAAGQLFPFRLKPGQRLPALRMRGRGIAEYFDGGFPDIG
jgi:hypothetical protein